MTSPRIGRFTSSEIVRLLNYGKRKMTAEELKARPKEGEGSAAKMTEDPTSFGAAALTYISEKRMERKAKTLLNVETWSKETAWGRLLEPRVFELLGTSYKPTGTDVALLHPKYPDYWAGTPDGQKYDIDRPYKVTEAKCPFTRKSFFTFAECKDISEVRANHTDGERYYWQCVSNAGILGVSEAELVIYMPYGDELPEVLKMAEECGDPITERWMARATSFELPYVNRDGAFSNMYTFAFEIPQADKERLEEAVERASKLLMEAQKIVNSQSVKIS